MVFGTATPTIGYCSFGTFGCPGFQHLKKAELSMRSAVKKIYRVSPTRTIPIHFYGLKPGRINQPSLMQFTGASFRGVTPGTVKQQVEKAISGIGRQRPELAQRCRHRPINGKATG